MPDNINNTDPFNGLDTLPVGTPSPETPDPFAGLETAPVPDRESATPDPFAGLATLPVQTNPEYEQVQKTSNRHFWEAPILGTEVTTDAELAAIARKHGIPESFLKAAAPTFGARTETEDQSVLSAVGRAVFAGLPQFVAKKALEDERYRNALDDVRELADAKRSVVQSGAEMIAPGGAIARIGKGFRGIQAGAAATGAAYGLAGSREGEEARGTIYGAGLGTLLGTAGAAVAEKLAGREVGKVGEATTPAEKLVDEGLQARKIEIEKGTDRILEEQKDLNGVRKEFVLEGAESTPEMLHRAERAFPEEVVRNTPAAELTHTAARDLQESAIDFAGRISREVEGGEVGNLERAAEVLKKAENNLGREYLEKQYDVWERERAGKDYLRKAELKAEPDVYGGAGRVADFLSDAQFVNRTIDSKFGTNLVPTHNELNSRLNRSTFARAPLDKEIAQLSREGDRIRQDPSEITAILEGAQTAAPNSEELVRKWRGLFDRMVEVAHAGDPALGVSPLPIRYRENYVPHQVMAVPEFVVAVRKKIPEMEAWSEKNLGKRLNQLSDLEIQGASEKVPEFSDFLSGLSWLDRNPIRTQGQLQNAMRDALQPTIVRDAQNLRAASPTFFREESIPTWIREKDVRKLASQWANATLKYMYIREPLQKLKSAERVLRAAGAERQANYVGRLSTDIMSVRSGTLASAQGALSNRIQIEARTAAEKSPEGSIRRGFYNTLASSPEFLSHVTNNIYSNMLGLNLRSILRNLPQTLLLTAPELGGTYGYGLALRGYADAAANFRKLSGEVERLGLSPNRFTGESREWMNRGILDSGILKRAGDGLEKLSEVSMYLYEKSDMINRAATLSVANKWAEDLMAKNSNAVSSLRKAPTAVQREALSLMGAGNVDRLRAVLAQHLNAGTQFNYNRASMSEFGRTMGPFFSTFSKWPTAIAGDLIHAARSQTITEASKRLAGKYLLPLAAAGMLQKFLFDSPEDMSDRQKKLLGSGGLADWTPILALKSLAKGDLMTPPAIDVALKTLKAGMAQDAEASDVGRGAAAAITQAFVPGAGVVRFITDDMSTLISGHAPSGNFFEKTEEGAHRLGRSL